MPSAALTRHVGIAKVHPGPRIALERVLDAHEDQAERDAAFSALRQEIPDFDARVEKERTRASVKVEAAKTHEEAGRLGGRGNKAKENSQSYLADREFPSLRSLHCQLR